MTAAEDAQPQSLKTLWFSSSSFFPTLQEFPHRQLSIADILNDLRFIALAIPVRLGIGD
jgi:hypothetical protein